MRPVLFSLFFALFLTACGQTGPLYLPKPEPAAPPAEPAAGEPEAEAATPPEAPAEVK